MDIESLVTPKIDYSKQSKLLFGAGIFMPFYPKPGDVLTVRFKDGKKIRFAGCSIFCPQGEGYFDADQFEELPPLDIDKLITQP